jgi:hypothetical protein
MKPSPRAFSASATCRLADSAARSAAAAAHSARCCCLAASRVRASAARSLLAASSAAVLHFGESVPQEFVACTLLQHVINCTTRT